MFCRKCGKELPEGAMFCNLCGTPCGEDLRQDSQSVSNTKLPYTIETQIQQPCFDNVVAATHGRFKLLIPILILAGILMVAVIWLISDTMKKPGHVSETGDYTLQLQDTFQFKSTKSAIRFEEVVFDKPQYDSVSNALTVPVTFVLRVDIPGKKYKDLYAEWLNDFSVNGIQATSSVIRYLPESDDCYLEYSVHYNSIPEDQSYLLTCKINDRLSLHFSYDQSFWENVNYEEAIAVGQSVLDTEYGIKYVDWQNGANSLNYVEDKVYCMTGKVASCGEYMWGITNQYYIILTATGALVDTHCYFTRDEWSRSPHIEVGDIVTFYGTFDFESFGWNFDDCTFTSPAGTFSLDRDSGTVSPSTPSPLEPSQDTDYSNNSDGDVRYRASDYVVDGRFDYYTDIDRTYPCGVWMRNDGYAFVLEYGSGDDVMIVTRYDPEGYEIFRAVSDDWDYSETSFSIADADGYRVQFDITKDNLLSVGPDRLISAFGAAGQTIIGEYYCVEIYPNLQ